MTEDVTRTRGTEWRDYGLRVELRKGLYSKGFERPSPVQEEVVPSALAGRNVLARAKNGTGKTASYLVPILEKLDLAAAKIQAVVLLPTRELALQTADVCIQLARYMDGAKIMCCVGGTPVQDDILRLSQTVHVVVATPARLLDFARKGVARLGDVRTLAFDEADKLLTGHFLEDVHSLLEFLPSNCQKLLLSATYPNEVARFVNGYVPDVVKINLMDELYLHGVKQFYAFVDESSKVRCLNTLLRQLRINQCIIFCNSVRRVELLARSITSLGYGCFFIHSQMPQQERSKIFQDFRDGLVRNLVTSDLFNRGIDIATVNVVINFDFPSRPDSYLHRVGRTGRFGHYGIAINMVTMEDRHNLLAVETQLGTEIKPIPQHIDESLY